MPGTVWRRPSWPVLLFCLLVPVWLSACSAATPSILTETPRTETPIFRLTLWHALPLAEGRTLRTLVDAWAADQPAPIQIDLERAPSADALHQRLLAAIQSSATPDLAIVRPADLPDYVGADALVPLAPSALREPGLFDNLLNPVLTAEEESYVSWPLYRHLVLLVLNQARADELGAAPDEPLTWQALVELCVRHRDHGGMPCYAAYPEGPVALLWLWSHGGELTVASGESVALDGEGGEEMMAWLASLRAVDGIQMVPSADDAREALARGDSLFNFASTAEMEPLDGAVGGAGPWTVTMPATRRGGSQTVATGPDLVRFRTLPAREAAAATSLFDYLSGSEAGYQWAQTSGAYPVRQGTLRRLVAEWPASSLLAQGADWLPVARTTPALSHWAELEQVLTEATRDTIAGRLTPEEALLDAGRRVQGILAP